MPPPSFNPRSSAKSIRRLYWRGELEATEYVAINTMNTPPPSALALPTSSWLFYLPQVAFGLFLQFLSFFRRFLQFLPIAPKNASRRLVPPCRLRLSDLPTSGWLRLRVGGGGFFSSINLNF
jgi:hypothetical protein